MVIFSELASILLDVSDDPSRIGSDEASEMEPGMENLTRKQREIKEREDRILGLARTMLAEGGYLGLSMDAIAEQLEYSKGTIYNHFPCKEEIIISLAVETMDRR
ncbi:MAG: AcrR family transcriptional regulator, partial [Porticoccaceae bacterium]